MGHRPPSPLPEVPRAAESMELGVEEDDGRRMCGSCDCSEVRRDVRGVEDASAWVVLYVCKVLYISLRLYILYSPFELACIANPTQRPTFQY